MWINIKVLYDFYHEQRGHGNLIQRLDGNMDLIGLVHVAEMPKRTEPGTGEIDYPVIYRKLAELKYSRTIAMEFMTTGDPVTSSAQQDSR
jgi:hydroxypyruvate isomerase